MDISNFPFKLVIWDLDGTLADTLQDLAACANQALALSGIEPHSLEKYRVMVGNGAMAMLVEAMGDLWNPESAKKVLQDYMRIYNQNCLRFVKPYPTARETVDLLHSAGIKQCIVTNKPEQQMHTIVDALFDKNTFVSVVGQSDRIPVKPDPAGVLEALELCGVTAAEALFVGDSDVDVQTAKNAGLLCAGACWGFRGREELEQAGADYLIDLAKDVLYIS